VCWLRYEAHFSSTVHLNKQLKLKLFLQLFVNSRTAELMVRDEGESSRKGSLMVLMSDFMSKQETMWFRHFLNKFMNLVKVLKGFCPSAQITET